MLDERERGIKMSTEYETLLNLSFFFHLELLEHLLPVGSARYSSATSCTPGTRIDLMDKLEIWAAGNLYSESPVYWLTGTGGTGKSTIARTITATLQTQHTVVTFFCTPADGRNDPRRIFPTISDQLSRLPEFSSFRTAVINEIKLNLAVKDASFEEQLKLLIVQPLQNVVQDSNIVVVIDSLDECSDVEEVHLFLKCLAENLRTIPENMRLFIASRKHARIHDAFNIFPSSSYQEHNLNAMHPDIVYEDIRTYLSAGFRQFRLEKNGRYTDWPQEEQITALARKSDFMFVYASTALKHVTSSLDPKGRLEQISTATTEVPQITFLYSQIMSSVISSEEESQRSVVEFVVGAITALARQLPVKALAQLLEMDEAVLLSVLDLFHSVIPVVNGMVRPCHSTWNEFIRTTAIPGPQLHTARETVIYKQFESDGTLDSLDKLIVYLQESLASLTSGDLGSACVLLSALSTASLDRFNQAGKTEDLDETIKCNRRLLGYQPPGHADRIASLRSLAEALRTRSSLGGRAEDLDEAIVWGHKALEECPASHDSRAWALDYTMDLLRKRFAATSSSKDIDEAIELVTELLELRSPKHPLHEDTLESLTSSLSARYEKTHLIEDISQIVVCNRKLVELCSPSCVDHHLRLDSLATSLSQLFEASGSTDNLEENIKLRRAILELRPPSHPLHTDAIYALGWSHEKRFKLTQNVSDVDQSIQLTRQMLELRPPGHSDRPRVLQNLSFYLMVRFKACKSPQSLDEAILLRKEVLVLRPVSDPLHVNALGLLSDAHDARFQLTQNIDDLEEALQLTRQLVALAVLGDSDRTRLLQNISIYLSWRFEVSKSSEDLDECVQLRKEVLALRPPSDPLHADAVKRLSVAHYTRFGATHNVEDLDQALQLSLRSVELSPLGHPNRYFSVMSLRNVFYQRFRHSGCTESLREAIQLEKHLLELPPPSNLLPAGILGHLPGDLQNFCDQTYPAERIQEKVQLTRQLLKNSTPSHPNRDDLLYFLVESLFLLFLHTGTMSQKDVDEAVELIEGYLESNNSARHKDSRFTLLYALALFRARGGMKDVADP